MKRMIAFFILIVFLFAFKFVSENNFPDFKFYKLTVVSKVSKLFESEAIKNGDQHYFSFGYEEGKKALEKIDIESIDGLVYYFQNSIGLENIKNKMDFYYQSEENISGMKIFYGYDSSYPDFRYIQGKKINVEIAQNSTNIIVGYPVILTGY